LHATSISAWLGRADPKSLSLLRAAPPDDAAFLRFAWSPPASGTWSTRISLDADHLLVDHTLSP
jgi:hypothetical protein